MYKLVSGEKLKNIFCKDPFPFYHCFVLIFSSFLLLRFQGGSLLIRVRFCQTPHSTPPSAPSSARRNHQPTHHLRSTIDQSKTKLWDFSVVRCFLISNIQPPDAVLGFFDVRKQPLWLPNCFKGILTFLYWFWTICWRSLNRLQICDNFTKSNIKTLNGCCFICGPSGTLNCRL